MEALERQIVALNMAIKIANIPFNLTIAGTDRVVLVGGKDDLELVRNRLLVERFGSDVIGFWLQKKQGISKLDAAHAQVIDDVEGLAGKLDYSVSQ